MSREEFLLRMKNITNMYSMPYRAENMQPIHYACREYDKLAYEQQKEIERLNNIINRIEYYIKTEIPEEEFVNTEWFVNILDKLKELKESGNNEQRRL